MRKLTIFTILISCLLTISNSCWAAPPFQLPAKAELNKIRSAVITTSKGNLYVKLFPLQAPWHVANFKYLSDKDFYKNSAFHIFRPGYLAQTGSAGTSAASGPGYSLPPEFNSNSHKKGALTMVRKPDYLDINHARNSHGSQFRIMLRDVPDFDKQFSVFGQVVEGFDVMENLTSRDYIENITVYIRN